ncbi:MAG: zf-HC2 domain-containing protein [Phycisphaerae bacterium]|nr:zf-HC2 domain-containing protein [Phycisphaerae bacterium]
MTLAAWCDGLLSQADREAIDVHVAACPRCADIVALVESDIAGDAAGPSLRIELELVIDRAAKLGPGRNSWRFIATRFSGIAAALLFAVLGGWIGMRLAMRLNTTSDRSDSTMASLSYGIVDDLDRELDASGDPLELVATQLFDGSTS